MTTQTQPKFKPGNRVFSHYAMDWGTVTKVLKTERDRYYRSTGKPEDRMDDTTWYDVRFDKGDSNMMDDAHGNWEMARIVPPYIASKYGYGKDPHPEKGHEHIIDADGKDILIGTRVKSDDTHPPGTVASITDVDGDADDEGRSIAILPYVYVKWDDADDTEHFSTHWTGRFQDDDAPFQCDDLTVHIGI